MSEETTDTTATDRRREESRQRRQAFEDAATVAGFTVDVAWLPNPGNSGDEWRDEAFRFEATVKHNGKAVLVTPYWAGLGHAVVYSYKARVSDLPRPYGRKTIEDQEIEDTVQASARRGELLRHPLKMSYRVGAKLPTVADILGSLCSEDPNDSTFEEWCSDFGYNTDSRTAEANYRTVTNNTLCLRRACGSDAWKQLRELANDL